MIAHLENKERQLIKSPKKMGKKGIIKIGKKIYMYKEARIFYAQYSTLLKL